MKLITKSSVYIKLTLAEYGVNDAILMRFGSCSFKLII